MKKTAAVAGIVPLAAVATNLKRKEDITEMAEFTPMMKQYLDIKKQHENCILFFRLGDFYEMFFDDAEVVSRELELTLTGKDCGQKERAPMCGVPFHSCESYIARLVQKGYKVAICEQTEDPALAKGLVKRDVVRIITPGTVIEGSMLDESRHNYLAAIWLQKENREIGLCFCDCSTGDINVTSLSGADMIQRLTNELGRFDPREVLINTTAALQQEIQTFLTDRLNVTADVREDDEFDERLTTEIVLSHFGKHTLDELQLSDHMPSVRALGCVLAYLRSTQMNGLERLNHLNVYSDVQHMRLDINTRRNLELLETMRSKEKRGSLLGVLDRTSTAMGKRLIRSWIEQPLIQPAPIIARLNAVEELVKNTVLRSEIREALTGVYDLERLMTRIIYGSANARELRSLCLTIGAVRPIKEALQGAGSTLLSQLEQDMDPLQDMESLLSSAIVDDPPFSVREGGMIREGYNPDLDELKLDLKDGKGIILRVEAQEREKTGIKNLKVGYNRVFGYYIEISRSYTGEIPPHYIRKQTLANAERYITQELKDLETRVLTANERSVALEYQLFTELRSAVAAQLTRIQKTAAAVAQLDVLASFAEVSARRKYCRPEISTDGELKITGGRHPVVESLSDAPFVPNNTLLDDRDNRIAMITGPNMAGKSTYMRQTALIVLMTQIGCFVPASEANITIVDSIFTRVGASDDLASGQSTFMVEMSEVAYILNNATRHSLLIFDEIGRGTSTFDGMSIARAVVEYVANPKKLGAKALFATHYHELTVLEDELSCVKNYNIAVKKRGDDITFLRRIVRGPADDSYGIEVAKLAGIPNDVVTRGKEILKGLVEAGESALLRPTITAEELPEDSGQLSFENAALSALAQELKELDVNTLTPIEALQTLYALVKKAQNL